jgi:hypothetical protein
MADVCGGGGGVVIVGRGGPSRVEGTGGGRVEPCGNEQRW